MPFLHLIQGLFSEDEKLLQLLNLAKPLAAVCPRLEYLYNSRSTGGRCYWRIIRKDGEAIRIESHGFRRDIPRYWEDD